MSVRITTAPSLRIKAAQARPIPLAAPVTNATFPASRPIFRFGICLPRAISPLQAGASGRLSYLDDALGGQLEKALSRHTEELTQDLFGMLAELRRRREDLARTH